MKREQATREWNGKNGRTTRKKKKKPAGDTREEERGAKRKDGCIAQR